MKCSPRHTLLSTQVLLECLSQAIFYTCYTQVTHSHYICSSVLYLDHSCDWNLLIGPLSFSPPFLFPSSAPHSVSSSRPAILPGWCFMVSLLCFVATEAGVRALCSAGSNQGQAESDSEQSLPWERDVKPWPFVGSRMRAVNLSLREALSSQQCHDLL